ncbi:hypothetical protein ACOME3_005542 [Neoechinorhynchus agilis]
MRSTLFGHLKIGHFIAGIAGGLVSTLVLHPLDLVKVRMQVDEGTSAAKKSKVIRPRYSGFVDALRKIYIEGGIGALYQGVYPSLIGAGLSWGLYFLVYNSLRSYYQSSDPTRQLSSITHMQNATLAGVLTMLVTNPIWVMKTRLCLQYKWDTNRYSGVFGGMVKVVREEGFTALYGGLVPAFFGTFHGTIQFGAYEYLKQSFRLYYGVDKDAMMGPIIYAICSGVSKILAAVALYPHQVIKSRLQQQHRHYRGTMHAIDDLLRTEGFFALYKGLLPTLVRVTPASCITFVVYEMVANALSPEPRKGNA